jgi:hypothetical protein
MNEGHVSASTTLAWPSHKRGLSYPHSLPGAQNAVPEHALHGEFETRSVNASDPRTLRA